MAFAELEHQKQIRRFDVSIGPPKLWSLKMIKIHDNQDLLLSPIQEFPRALFRYCLATSSVKTLLCLAFLSNPDLDSWPQFHIHMRVSSHQRRSYI